MSQAFMRERDEQWLHEITPTLNALTVYLTRENNGITVYLKNNFYSETEGREIYEMSNGFSYAINDDSQWYVID
jgi:hypothetical protein